MNLTPEERGEALFAMRAMLKKRQRELAKAEPGSELHATLTGRVERLQSAKTKIKHANTEGERP